MLTQYTKASISSDFAGLSVLISSFSNGDHSCATQFTPVTSSSGACLLLEISTPTPMPFPGFFTHRLTPHYPESHAHTPGSWKASGC